MFVAPRGLLVVHLRARALSPRVYFDWGLGFSQAESAGFDVGDDALFVFDFAGRRLCALRLDPFARIGEVEMRYGFAAEGEALLREAGGHARVVPVKVADHAPGRRRRARGPRSTAEHFRHVTALAAREFEGRFDVAPPTPLISFVCPLYDTPPAYFDDLLASFRPQKPGWAELVLSDDGSTSARTARWLDAHAGEPGLTILRGAANRGIAGASNAGIAAARGAWIGFIDHDDALAPQAVAVIARAIEDNPQARFLYTDELIADGRLKPVGFFDKPCLLYTSPSPRD